MARICGSVSSRASTIWREAHVLQEARLLGRADVGLGAGVQLDRRQVQLQQAHVLHDQRVGAGVVELPGQLARALQLVVAQDGVERDEDAALKRCAWRTRRAMSATELPAL
jgi:hypothetical protein